MRENWSAWSSADVCAWLETLGLIGDYRQTFIDNAITGDILSELTKDVLKEELGIKAYGDRVRICRAIEALTAPPASSTAPPTTGSSTATSSNTTPQTATTTAAAAASTNSDGTAPGAAAAASRQPVAPSPSAPLPRAPLPPPPKPRDSNVLDLVVLHAAPLVIKDSKGRIYPMEKLDLAAERRAIVSSLVNEVAHKGIHFRFDIATADVLRSLMTAWRCKVLHFSGHGLGQNPALCFEDGAGCTHMITPDLLRQLTFSGSTPRSDGLNKQHSMHHLELVFVNSCHSQKVASVFLNAGIRHVIAVHSDSLVVDASATMFAKHFYLSLFSGDTVRTAFEIAKGLVRASPTQRRAACCCAHLHEPNCAWMLAGSRHSHHNPKQCCCKGHQLSFPHDESSKFLLLGADNSPAAHDVVLFGNVPNGQPTDHTPRCKSSIPSMHGQFIGRNSETYLMVKSLLENAVTACLGAPGIGKSSLVISVAHFVHSRRMFPDGVFYVDLEGQKVSTVRYAIAQTMGIPAADTDEEVFAELGSKRCLLVLDKAEELLDEDEGKTQQLLGKLISMAPNTRLLLASRRIPHIPNVTAYSLSLSQLPLRTAVELLCLVAPGCSPKHAERLATICGCLPLAIRVVGRALANARTDVTPEQMIEYLERDGQRFESIKELNQVGHRECVDRCIRSSFCHLEEPLRLVFMVLGFFRGSFDEHAVQAVLSPPVNDSEGSGRALSRPQSTSSSGGFSGSYFPKAAYARSSSRRRDDDTSSMKSLGSELLSIDVYGFDNDGAMTSDSYDLLDLECPEEVKARSVSVLPAATALSRLTQWSLVEHDSRTRRYRMHNLVQLFAEREACRVGDLPEEMLDCPNEDDGPRGGTNTPADPDRPCVPLGRELVLAWRRRFVRYFCVIVAKASHAYRFEGTLTLFDKERPNIESAMRVAQDLTVQSIGKVRDFRNKRQQELIDAGIGDGVNTPLFERGESEANSDWRAVRDSVIVDALLYCNLVVRSRFILRTRVEPKRRIQDLTSCLQLSRETRTLCCTCGSIENDPGLLLWDIEDVKFDRELGVLDVLPSFEEAQQPLPVTGTCSCVGIRELIALEALLLNDLGNAYCDATDWVAGEYYYLEALRLQREVLGWSEHAQVAEVLNQLGICLSTRWGFLAFNTWLLQHAEKLLKGGLMMRMRVLGDKHPEYATSLNNLANFYRHCGTLKKKSPPSAVQLTDSVGDLNDARPVLVRSASSMDTSSDAGSESVTSTRSSENGGVETEDEGPDIEGMYRRSLEIRETALGKNHPQVAQSLNNLALFLAGKLESSNLSDTELQMQRDEIAKLFERALAIRRSTLGNASLETAATLNNMGSFKRLLRDWKGAQDDIEEALRITDRYFSEGSPRAARMFINLARVYKDQSRYEDAIQCYRKAQEIRQQLFPDSREVGYCIEQIGKCMKALGQTDDGKRMEEQGRQMRRMSISITSETTDDVSSSPTGEATGSHLLARVNVLDIVDVDALVIRKFHFVGRLLGERGINLKRIEAISCAQLRYNGRCQPPESGRVDQAHEQPHIRIAGTSEQNMERAKTLCIDLLRDVKSKWEQFVANGSVPSRAPRSAPGSGRAHHSQHQHHGRHHSSSGSAEHGAPRSRSHGNRRFLHAGGSGSSSSYGYNRPPHSNNS
ncbi:hypothetical protein PINS_up005682 [Pythium insidiosum]|nr:hypothetical protein PINS_up005682 [Pythium insidiosum]